MHTRNRSLSYDEKLRVLCPVFVVAGCTVNCYGTCVFWFTKYSSWDMCNTQFIWPKAIVSSLVPNKSVLYSPDIPLLSTSFDISFHHRSQVARTWTQCWTTRNLDICSRPKIISADTFPGCEATSQRLFTPREI